MLRLLQSSFSHLRTLRVKRSIFRNFTMSGGSHNSLTGHLLCAIPYVEPKQVLKRIRAAQPGLKVTFIQTSLSAPGALKKHLPDEIWRDVTVLATLYDYPSTPELAPELKWIHLVSAGSDHMQNSPLYTDPQIPITTSSGIHGPIIGEWVTMTMLVASHKYNILHDWQNARNYDDSQSGKAVFAPVSDRVNKRLGILGYGSIGRQVARTAKSLGMDIVAFTRNARTTRESRRDHGYVVPGMGDPEGEVPSAWFSGEDRESLHHFLAQDLDHLLISIPLTTQTRHLLGKEEFRILARRNAFVTNIARGDVLVQDDLIEALHEFEASKANGDGLMRGLSGAALDVATPEPLPKDSPLWDAPNCIITPHMSGSNRDYATRALEVLEQNLERWASGQTLLNVIDREAGYASKTG